MKSQPESDLVPALALMQQQLAALTQAMQQQQETNQQLHDTLADSKSSATSAPDNSTDTQAVRNTSTANSGYYRNVEEKQAERATVQKPVAPNANHNSKTFGPITTLEQRKMEVVRHVAMRRSCLLWVVLVSRG